MASKICGKCGESNSTGAVYCVACSASLKDADVIGKGSQEKNYNLFRSKKRPARCLHCSQPLQEGQLRCAYCGTVNTKDIRRPRIDYDSSSGVNGCAVILVFVITLLIPLVGLIVGAIFAFSDDEDKKMVGIGLMVFGLVVIGLGFVIGLSLF